MDTQQDQTQKFKLAPTTWLFLGILLLAVLTRLIDLGARVMSHDEINHVYFAWLWFDGGSYQHNPISHGPLQFHLLNLSYTLFGDTDVAARLPAALSGIAVVAISWSFRRWFNRRGTLVVALLLTLSPYMLYYSRYARNEVFVVLETLLTLLAIFRYLETRKTRWLYLLAGTLALHAATKETFYILVAQWLVFLGAWFVVQLLSEEWPSDQQKTWFGASVILSALGMGLALVEFLRERSFAGEAAIPLTSTLVILGAGLGLIGLISTGVILIRSFGPGLREDFPLLDVLLLMTTLTLPLLAALPAQALGWDPMAYSDSSSITRTAITVIVLLAISLALGLSWDHRRWLIAAGIFILIYIPLYTTLFTNPFGAFSGLVGSLGYWLVQQGVERGSQPWYYYALLQIPLYEFLPAIGAFLGAGFALIQLGRSKTLRPARDTETPSMAVKPMLILSLIYFSVTTLVIYSFAGERMPWITVHLTVPLILLSGWWFGEVFSEQALGRFFSLRALGVFSLVLIIYFALSRGLRFVSGLQASLSSVFQGAEQLTGWMLPIMVGVIAVMFLIRLWGKWNQFEVLEMSTLAILLLLLIQTTRTSLRAAFVKYDSAEEYLVYAHAAPGPKWAMELVEEISQRTTGGTALAVGYDNDAAYPLWWYLRDYPNAFGFGAEPNRTIREYPLVFASDANAARYEAYLGEDFQSMTFERLWWPREDYNNLSWQSLSETLTDPQMIKALWDIWFDRDYELYGQITGRDVTARGWQPASRMKLYIRNDYAPGVTGLVEPGVDPDQWVFQDLYAAMMVDLQAELILGGTGSTPGLFSAPRGIATGGEDLVYITDSNNHRIQVFTDEGEFLQTWGYFSDTTGGEAAVGGFNQPWDLAVASDGSVVVVDTWNHRIQRFNPAGKVLQVYDANAEWLSPNTLYGPRSIAIDARDGVFVADTGNKRILQYSLDGELLGAFGSGGLGLGNLDEPVGLSSDRFGQVWVADTWNQRVQLFESYAPNQYQAVKEWPVEAWFGQSIENKPYLAISPQDHICITDPEGGRVLCFNQAGEPVLGFTGSGMVLPSGIAFDPQCRIWLTDAGSDRVLRFNPGLCGAVDQP